MRRTVSPLWLLLVASALLASCAHYTPRLSTSEMPTGKEAYLYGRFFIDVSKSALALDQHRSIGFQFVCTDGAGYQAVPGSAGMRSRRQPARSGTRICGSR